MVNIIDLIIFAAAVVIIVMSAKKGFVKSCLDALSVVISGFVSFKFYKPVAVWFYDLCVDDLIKTSFNKVIDDMSKSASFEQKASVMLAELPQSALKIANGIGIDSAGLLKNINQATVSDNDALIDAMSTVVARPIMLFVTEIIVFMILVVVSGILIRMFANFFSDNFKKIPVVGKADTVLGGFLGVIKSAVILIVVTTLFYIILATAEEGSPLDAIGTSKVYQFLADFNPVISILKG